MLQFDISREFCFHLFQVDVNHDQEYKEQRVGEKTKCREKEIGETESNKPFI